MIIEAMRRRQAADTLSRFHAANKAQAGGKDRSKVESWLKELAQAANG